MIRPSSPKELGSPALRKSSCGPASPQDVNFSHFYYHVISVYKHKTDKMSNFALIYSYKTSFSEQINIKA